MTRGGTNGSKGAIEGVDAAAGGVGAGAEGQSLARWELWPHSAHTWRARHRAPVNLHDPLFQYAHALVTVTVGAGAVAVAGAGAGAGRANGDGAALGSTPRAAAAGRSKGFAVADARAKGWGRGAAPAPPPGKSGANAREVSSPRDATPKACVVVPGRVDAGVVAPEKPAPHGDADGVPKGEGFARELEPNAGVVVDAPKGRAVNAPPVKAGILVDVVRGVGARDPRARKECTRDRGETPFMLAPRNCHVSR